MKKTNRKDIICSQYMAPACRYFKFNPRTAILGTSPNTPPPTDMEWEDVV